MLDAYILLISKLDRTRPWLAPMSSQSAKVQGVLLPLLLPPTAQCLVWYRSIWRWWRGRGKFFGWWITGLDWRPPMILHYMRLLYVHGQVLSVMRIIPMLLLTKEREILVEDGLIWKCIVCIIASLVINYIAASPKARHVYLVLHQIMLEIVYSLMLSRTWK